MPAKRGSLIGSRWALIAMLVFFILLVGGIVGFRVAAGVLKGKIAEALGPNSEVRDVRVGWFSVKAHGVEIKGPNGWPAADALTAERVSLVPSLRSIFSGQFRIRSITIVKPYLSALRTKEGKFLLLPGLLTGTSSKDQAKALSSLSTFPRVTIGHITLQDAVVEFFDATVAEPPLKIRLEQINASVRNMVVPALRGKSRFELAGVVKGIQRDGQIEIEGWAEVSANDYSVKTQLRSVDMLVLQSYLVKPGETAVKKGTLDLDLQSDVANNLLNAPGEATISDLEFVPAEGRLDTFMGLPHRAVLAYLTRNKNRITIDFVLDGDVSNPQFSLNQTLTERMAFGMAKVLGIDLVGMVKGVGTLGQKGGEAVEKAGKDTGGWLWRLLGGKKKH